jgi:hypothetical protein
VLGDRPAPFMEHLMPESLINFFGITFFGINSWDDFEQEAAGFLFKIYSVMEQDWMP